MIRHRLFKNAVVMACLLATSSLLWAKNSFLVAPGRVTFDLNKPSTQSFIITNNGDGKIRLSIKPVFFQIDEKALSMGKPIVPNKKPVDDLTQYIKVSPKTLSLKPGQRRDIRISVRAPGTLADGDYRGHLLVAMKEKADTLGAEQDPLAQNELSIKLNINMETAVAIYGGKGEGQANLFATCALNDKGHLVVTNTNPSIWRFDGFIQIFGKDTAKPAVSSRLISLRESIRDTLTTWKPDSDEITLQWKIKEDDAQAAQQATCKVTSA